MRIVKEEARIDEEPLELHSVEGESASKFKMWAAQREPLTPSILATVFESIEIKTRLKCLFNIYLPKQKHTAYSLTKGCWPALRTWSSKSGQTAGGSSQLGRSSGRCFQTIFAPSARRSI